MHLLTNISRDSSEDYFSRVRSFLNLVHEFFQKFVQKFLPGFLERLFGKYLEGLLRKFVHAFFHVYMWGFFTRNIIRILLGISTRVCPGVPLKVSSAIPWKQTRCVFQRFIQIFLYHFPFRMQYFFSRNAFSNYCWNYSKVSSKSSSPRN